MLARNHKKSEQGDGRGKPRDQRLGLLAWAERVPVEMEKAAVALDADPVHDLRVAIRRCRSIAQGLRSISPLKEWKEFRDLAKPLFSALGALRDLQIMRHWCAQLAPAEDPLGQILSSSLLQRENDAKISVREALAEFDRRRWNKLSRKLDRTAHSLTRGALVLQLVALERLIEAQRMHDHALKTGRAADFHRLRIGIKHFRYNVENFLPEHHRAWKDELKRAQDLLGDVHDLDVLHQEIARIPNIPTSIRDSWNARIASARGSRLTQYLDLVRDGDLWTKWRANLPTGRQLSIANQVKFQRWSAALDKDRAHSRRVGSTALALWRQLREPFGWNSNGHTAQQVRIAAWLHGVGSAKRDEKRLKFLTRKLEKLSVPVGWTKREMDLVRFAARYASGATPGSDTNFGTLPIRMQRDVLRVAGVLRLADALDRATGGRAGVPLAQKQDGTAIIRVSGFNELSEGAEEVAAARHLLEYAENVPVLVLPDPTSGRTPAINR